ncbi:MAG: hypothetical protein AAB518_00170, partial [Patescibacteria group bacterium]
MFTITRTGATTSPLAVVVAISGSAANGTDYVAIPTTRTIHTGSSSLKVKLITIAADVVAPSETVILTLS